MLGSGSGQYDDDWNEIYYEFDEKYYYENGQISSDRYVERGEVTGYKEFEKEYYENGQLTFEKEYYESPDFVGNFSGKYYYENGQLSWTDVWGTDENDIISVCRSLPTTTTKTAISPARKIIQATQTALRRKIICIMSMMTMVN